MWSVFFTITFSGSLITMICEASVFWRVIFAIATYLCCAMTVITEQKSKEKIECLENKIEKMVGEDK